MTSAIRNAAENVVQNVILTAVARLAMAIMAIVLPAMLAAGAWAVEELNAQDRRLARIEAEKGDFLRRLAEMERRDSDDAVRASATLVALAELRAQQGAMLRSVERIERFVDTARVPATGGSR